MMMSLFVLIVAGDGSKSWLKMLLKHTNCFVYKWLHDFVHVVSLDLDSMINPKLNNWTYSNFMLVQKWFTFKIKQPWEFGC